MSDLVLNIRFGVRHLQIHRNRPWVTFRINPAHVQVKPTKWFEVYEAKRG